MNFEGLSYLFAKISYLPTLANKKKLQNCKIRNICESSLLASIYFLTVSRTIFFFRVVEAHQALFKLYGPNYRVTEEVEIIQEDLKKLRETRGKKSEYLRNLKNHPQVYKPFLIIVTLSIIQQFSGMSILRAYPVKIFDEVFHDEEKSNANQNVTLNDVDQGNSRVSNEAYISAIIMGFVRLLASLILANLLRKYNRRHMYFASAGMTIASLVCFATCALHHSRFVNF